MAQVCARSIEQPRNNVIFLQVHNVKQETPSTTADLSVMAYRSISVVLLLFGKLQHMGRQDYSLRTKSVLDAAFLCSLQPHSQLLVSIAGRDFSSLTHVVIKAGCGKQRELHIRRPLSISSTVEYSKEPFPQLGRQLRNINLSILLSRASHKRKENMTQILPQRKLKLGPWCKRVIL